MQRIHFCSGSVFVTGDRIATSLLQHVRAVAMMRRSEVLDVPVQTASGSVGTVTLLLNEAVQISAESMEPGPAELEDELFVRDVDARTADLLAAEVWTGTD